MNNFEVVTVTGQAQSAYRSHSIWPRFPAQWCSAGCLLILAVLFFSVNSVAGQPIDATDAFEDTQLEEEIVYPDWFKLGLGDLRADLEAAIKANKQGIVVYFGQKRCAYCEQFMQKDLGSADIANYMQEHFDVIPVDIWGIEEIIDIDGKPYTERELSIKYETNFTPSLVFFDAAGKAVFGLRGFYPPYKFRAALKYVAEGFYKNETFREYLARAEPGMFFMLGGLNERDFFSTPPYDLTKIRKTGKPLVVFFEQGNCHACDLLHSGPLSQEETLQEIRMMTAVQLDMWSDVPVITPQGEHTTAKQWAKELGLFHAPTLIFFDPGGNEIIRIDSIVQFYRLWGVLDYVNKRAYETEPDYQAWRLKQRKIQ